MNCENLDKLLDDWLDGELPPAEARALEAHAAACEACRRQVDAAQRLQRAASALPATREPARDLWPGIASRIGQERRERRWPHAIAASVALVAVFAGGMLANRLLMHEQAGAPLAGRSGQPDVSVADARRILPASYVELVDAAATGSGTEQALLQNLLIVNLAIRDTENAIAENPANADLRELLAGLYAQENRILAQAERMRAARQVPVRTTI